DERREMRSDRGRQLGGVAKVRRDVREVLHHVGVGPLPEERTGDPSVVTGIPARDRPALRDGPAEPRESAVLVGAVAGMVPAAEVEELVARRETHLPQSFVRLDPGREPDLVPVGPVPAAPALVVAIERTAIA